MSPLHNLALFIFICALIYGITMAMHSTKAGWEGMQTADTDKDSSKKISTGGSNGIAGNAETYAATIKAAAIKLQDSFLIGKYKSDYETVILNMDDLINNQMLNTILSANPDNLHNTIDKLARMQQAKAALNSTMVFIDRQ